MGFCTCSTLFPTFFVPVTSRRLVWDKLILCLGGFDICQPHHLFRQGDNELVKESFVQVFAHLVKNEPVANLADFYVSLDCGSILIAFEKPVRPITSHVLMYVFMHKVLVNMKFQNNIHRISNSPLHFYFHHVEANCSRHELDWSTEDPNDTQKCHDNEPEPQNEVNFVYDYVQGENAQGFMC